MPGATTTLPPRPAAAPVSDAGSSQIGSLQTLNSLERGVVDARAGRSGGSVLLAATALLVTLPVFVQAPWVRDTPLAAALFTLPLLLAGVLLQQHGSGRWADFGALLVGFSGSWLGGAIFWGWFRDQPLMHLPIEAFALPLAIGGWSSRWRLACGFYLGSLAGTASTDLVMACSGVIRRWPAVVNAPLDEAPQLLHQAGLSLLHPFPLGLILAAAVLLVLACRWLWTGGEPRRIAAAALGTTVLVDGLFLAAALAAPRLSGLI